MARVMHFPPRCYSFVLFGRLNPEKEFYQYSYAFISCCLGTRHSSWNWQNGLHNTERMTILRCSQDQFFAHDRFSVTQATANRNVFSKERKLKPALEKPLNKGLMMPRAQRVFNRA